MAFDSVNNADFIIEIIITDALMCEQPFVIIVVKMELMWNCWVV